MECWELKKWVLNGVERKNHWAWSKGTKKSKKKQLCIGKHNILNFKKLTTRLLLSNELFNMCFEDTS